MLALGFRRTARNKRPPAKAVKIALMTGWFTQSCYRRKPSIGLKPKADSHPMARTKRLGDGGERRRMSRSVQRRATKNPKMNKLPWDERRFQRFEEFLPRFIKELNELSTEGGAVLVEGKRDVAALRSLGYSGPIFSVSVLTSSRTSRQKLRDEVREMAILTDLDAEGRRLASRYVRFLAQEGVKSSLGQRRRLSEASRGVFLHVENLARFAPAAIDQA